VRRRRGGALALAAAALLWAGPAGADTEEELGLRAQAAQVHQEMEEVGSLWRDPASEAYLEGVLRRTLGEAAQGQAFRVRVLDWGGGGAFSISDGSIFVSAHLLAELGDEAELAALLGHEAAHVLRHHSASMRHAVRRAGVITVATLGLGLLPAVGGLAGHSRDQERAADADAIGYLARAGYDPAGAVTLDVRLRGSNSSWLASHPSQEERVATARAAVARLPSGGERGAERFAVAIATVRVRAAQIDLALALFDDAEREGQAAVAAAPTAAGWVASGDVARLGKVDLPAAAARYRAAIALDPGCAAAHRGLGLALLRSGDRAGARAALRRYLELLPGAPDRPFVEAELQGLEDRT
jgi:predicted Zn-dependent protease